MRNRISFFRDCRSSSAFGACLVALSLPACGGRVDGGGERLGPGLDAGDATIDVVDDAPDACDGADRHDVADAHDTADASDTAADATNADDAMGDEPDSCQDAALDIDEQDAAEESPGDAQQEPLPACPGGLLDCGGACIDPLSSPFHCGASGDCTGMVVEDVDGDDAPDIVFPGGAGVTVLWNDGSGVFASRVFLPTGLTNWEPEYAAVGDMNGDGRLDVVAAMREDGWGSCGRVHVLLNRGLVCSPP